MFTSFTSLWPQVLVIEFLGVLFLALAAIGVAGALDRARRSAASPESPMAHGHGSAVPLVTFADLDHPGQVITLTEEHLSRTLLITGIPGCGKTSVLAEIGAATMAHGTPDQPVNTITFDASADVAGRMAYLSELAGRRCIVVDIGHPRVACPLQVPRPGPAGARGFADSVRDVSFPFQTEVPAQLYVVIWNVALLLDAAEFGLDQSLRFLLNDRFRNDVFAAGRARLPTHAAKWIALVNELNKPDRQRLLQSTMARLFDLLENDATRAVYGGRGGLDLCRLVDPLTGDDSGGTGLDLIVTANPALADKELGFTLGLALDQVAGVMRLRLDPPSRGCRPQLLWLVDELGRYAAPGATLDAMQQMRNMQVQAVFACHTTDGLHEQMKKMLMLHPNRLAGADIGDSAQHVAQAMTNYRYDAVATRREDGRPASHWSEDAQRAYFAERLRTLHDSQFALMRVNSDSTVWGAAQVRASAVPTREAASAALERAIERSGRPVAEVLAELDQIDQALDRQYGPVDMQEVIALARQDDSWRTRGPEDYGPI
jgi:hypothetical protein